MSSNIWYLCNKTQFLLKLRFLFCPWGGALGSFRTWCFAPGAVALKPFFAQCWDFCPLKKFPGFRHGVDVNSWNWMIYNLPSSVRQKKPKKFIQNGQFVFCNDNGCKVEVIRFSPGKLRTSCPHHLRTFCNLCQDFDWKNGNLLLETGSSSASSESEASKELNSLFSKLVSRDFAISCQFSVKT